MNKKTKFREAFKSSPALHDFMEIFMKYDD